MVAVHEEQDLRPRGPASRRRGGGRRGQEQEQEKRGVHASTSLHGLLSRLHDQLLWGAAAPIAYPHPPRPAHPALQ